MDRRALVALAWLGFVAATEHWYDWHRPIALQFGRDAAAYEQIARAAPSFPDTPLATQHAERFPLHWLIGTLAHGTGLGLHLAYWIGMGITLGALVVVMHLILGRLGIGLRAYAICLGALVGSAYAFRFELTVPGMLSDAAFLVGLSLVVLAFTRENLRLLVGGLVLATLARQTAVPLVLVAVPWVATAPRRRLWQALALGVVPLALYAAIAAAAKPFAYNDFGGLRDFGVFGSFGQPRILAAAWGRALLGVALPAALCAGVWIRSGRRLTRAGWACAGAAALVVIQPIVLGPGYVVSNEARLTALATPALVALAAIGLRDVRLTTSRTLAACGVIALGSFHHLYSAVDPGRAGWVALELGASAAMLGVLAWPRLAPQLGDWRPRLGLFRDAGRPALAMSRSFWWAIASLLLMVMGALGPWAHAVRARIDGPQDEVVLALAFATAVLLVAFAGTQRRWLALVPLFIGATAAVLTGRDVRDSGDIAPHVNEHLAAIDWGLYLTVLGSISLVLASTLLMIEGASPQDEKLAVALVGGGDEVDVRTAFFSSAQEFTPYVAVEAETELFFVETKDSGVGGPLFAKRTRGDMKHLARAVRLLEQAGLLRSGTTFVDVGANIGTTTVTALKHGYFARAVSMEPAPRNADLLRLNILANKIEPAVTVLELAITDREGEAELVLSGPSSGKNILSPSVPFGRSSGETVTVPCATLDSLVARGVIDPVEVGLLWIDTPHHEEKVLTGASTLLAAGVPVVACVRSRSGHCDDLKADLLRVFAGYTDFADLRARGGLTRNLGDLLDSLPTASTDILALRRPLVALSSGTG